MQTFLCRDKLLNLFVYPRLPWEFSIVVVFLRQDFIVYPKATLEFQTLLSQPPRAGIRHAPQAHQGSCLVSLWGFYIYLDCGVGGWGTHTCGGQVTTEGVICPRGQTWVTGWAEGPLSTPNFSPASFSLFSLLLPVL